MEKLKMDLSFGQIPVNEFYLSVEIEGDHDLESITVLVSVSEVETKIKKIIDHNLVQSKSRRKEVRRLVQEVIDRKGFTIPDMITFDPETGEVEQQ